jgi:hypothetical protein
MSLRNARRMGALTADAVRLSARRTAILVKDACIVIIHGRIMLEEHMTWGRHNALMAAMHAEQAANRLARGS